MNYSSLKKHRYQTPSGVITYWVSSEVLADKPWFVFLPGLTADHRLFEKQLTYFDGKANILVWDAPSHGQSRPFALTWSLDDKARWLKQILDVEGIDRPILVGQSMGGYVSQAFMDLFPGTAKGFVSIDSCPLQRSYYTSWELWFLKHTKTMFLMFPWKTLVDLGSKNNAVTPYGQHLMALMMQDYNKREYCELSAHGFNALACAAEMDRASTPDCPILLICGKKDNAGSAKRYNSAWSAQINTPIEWIENAGHNSNTDQPEVVNELLEAFATTLS